MSALKLSPINSTILAPPNLSVHSQFPGKLQSAEHFNPATNTVHTGIQTNLRTRLLAYQEHLERWPGFSSPV